MIVQIMIIDSAAATKHKQKNLLYRENQPEGKGAVSIIFTIGRGKQSRNLNFMLIARAQSNNISYYLLLASKMDERLPSYPCKVLSLLLISAFVIV